MKHPFQLPRAIALTLALAAGQLGAAVAPAPAPAAPQDARGLLNLGKSLADRGDYASSEIAYREILSRAGDSPADQASALLGLARTYRKGGAATKAAAIYQKFTKEFPDDERLPDALLELGRALRSLGASKLALNQFYSVINTTLKLPPQSFEHYQSLARTAEYEIAETFYENGEYERAGKYFARLQLLDLSAADRARACFMAAHSQLLAGDLDTGIRTLHTYLDAWPDDENVPEARYLLATTLRKLKRPQEALATVLDLLREEKSHDASDPQAWAYWQRKTGNLLANDFFQSGDMVSALAIYQGMSKLSPDAAWQLPVLYQVALCEERLYDFEKAAVAYRTIVAAAAAAKPAPLPEIAELAEMSAWRLNHIEWLQNTNSKLAAISSPPAEDAAPTPNPQAP